jgi:hypothetical protein
LRIHRGNLLSPIADVQCAHFASPAENRAFPSAPADENVATVCDRRTSHLIGIDAHGATLQVFHDLSHAAAVAPQADVEAVTETVTELAAEIRELGRGLVEFRGGAALGHQQDALVRNFITTLQHFYFR